MTRYYTNFEDSNIGEFPIGWTRRNLLHTTYPISAEYGTPKVKRREVKVTGAATGACISMDAIDADANRKNVETLSLHSRRSVGSPQTGSTRIHIWSRVAEGALGLTGYRFLFIWPDDASGSTVVIQYFLNGTAITTVLSAAPAIPLDPTKDYYIRTSTQDLAGSPSTVELKYKVWAHDQDEPAAWTGTHYDSSLFGVSGSTGFLMTGGPSVSVAGYTNFFSVGTNGDTAWKPRTNAEYQAWLDDQTAVRRTLIEMSTIGYEATAQLQQPLVNLGLNYEPITSPATSLPRIPAISSIPVGSPTQASIVTPDSAANSITGDLSILFHAGHNLLGSTTNKDLLSKWSSGAISYGLQILASGAPRFFWFDGSTVQVAACTELLNTAEVNIEFCIAAYIDANNGTGGSTVYFYRSYDRGQTWAQFGDAITVAVSTGVIADLNSEIQVGSIDGGEVFSGSIYRAQLYNGNFLSGGVRVLDFHPASWDPSTVPSAFGGSYQVTTTYKSQTTSETWYLRPPTVIATDFHNTFVAQRKVFLSSGGFTSGPFDSPSNQHYDAWVTKVPSFKRELPIALTGQATTGFGSLVVSNPRGSSGAGVRDDWIRMKWQRNYLKQYLGDESWYKHDFRAVLIGRVGQPKAGSAEITFEISDLSDSFNELLQKQKFSSSYPDLEGKPIPLTIGYVGLIEPMVANDTTREYRLHDGPMGSGAIRQPAIAYDNWVSLTTATMAGQADASTDLITTLEPGSPTTPKNHGFLADYLVRLSGVSMPGGLTSFGYYYVLASGLTPTAFKVGLTKGGAAINLTSNGGVLGVVGYGAHFDMQQGKMYLATSPVGRVVTNPVGAQSTYDSANGNGYIVDVLDYMLFKKFGLSRNFRDAASFDALGALMSVNQGNQVGLYFGPQEVLMRNAMLKLFNGIFGWFGFAPDGRLQVGQISLPDSTSVMSFLEGDVKEGTLRPINRILPVDMTKCPVTYMPKYFNSPANSGQPVFDTPYATQTPGSYTAPSAPVDILLLGDSRNDLRFDTVLSGGSSILTRLTTLFAKMLGVFEFQTRFRATELSIGDTISLTHSQFGWKSWSAADPSSPDNTTTIDSTKARVIGIDTDLNSNDPYPVKLTVFRQIPMYAPTDDLN